MALSHPYTAVHLAQVFLDNVDKLPGLPASILSERDKVFTILEGALHNGGHWAGTHLDISTAYHPQTSGQTERLSRCLFRPI